MHPYQLVWVSISTFVDLNRYSEGGDALFGDEFRGATSLPQLAVILGFLDLLKDLEGCISTLIVRNCGVMSIPSASSSAHREH
jgi:hypothetical protein